MQAVFESIIAAHPHDAIAISAALGSSLMQQEKENVVAFSRKSGQTKRQGKDREGKKSQKATAAHPSPRDNSVG